MKKTLFVKANCKECTKVINFFEKRFDLKILDLDQNISLAQKLDVISAPTLVVEEWDEQLNFVGLEKIEEYLSDEPTPKYPCVCSE
ncbi:MAG: hypothetical protein ACRC5W_10245 [Cetobacterium sp.]|uniref:hypothetical protein n=1 Tax=Cetobacterium sp. TaxID=2071632 RepID=UPI003F32BB64